MWPKTQIIKVKNISISLTTIQDEDYICLTDIAKAKEGDSRAADIIKNWIRNRATLEFLGTWEEIYNPDFKGVEFDHFKSELIKEGLDADTRLKRLNQIAIRQMKIMIENKSLKKLEGNR